MLDLTEKLSKGGSCIDLDPRVYRNLHTDAFDRFAKTLLHFFPRQFADESSDCFFNHPNCDDDDCLVTKKDKQTPHERY